MSTVFAKIISKEIPANIIAENDYCIAFLDIRPLVKGHVIVISKEDFSDCIFDMSDFAYTRLMSFAKDIAQILKDVVPCKRIGIMVAGFEVSHAHIHLLPINESSQLNFNSTPLEISKETMYKLASEIAFNYSKFCCKSKD